MKVESQAGSPPPPPPHLPTPPPPQALVIMRVNCEYIDALNNNLDLDFFPGYNRDYVDPNINDDPYCGTKCNSKFYDIQSLSCEEFIRNSPIFLSINIQSLQSKYEQLLLEIADFASSNINILILIRG